MAITAVSLPLQPFIPEQNHTFYKIGINPVNNEIFITDVVDYVQKGKILRYGKEGVLISQMEADIIPGTICFKVNSDHITE
jgi:hypothetical protein